MPRTIDQNSAAAGYAALSISESLLLALVELKIIAEVDACGVLADAAATHRGAAAAGVNVPVHLAAAILIERLMATRAAALRP